MAKLIRILGLSLLLASAADASYACSGALADQAGHQNLVEIEATGCGYTDVLVDGNFNSVTAERHGSGNDQFISAYGGGHEVGSLIIGRDNFAGVVVDGAQAAVDTRIIGNDSTVDIYVEGDGAVTATNRGNSNSTQIVLHD
jgi:hypothetical protein